MSTHLNRRDFLGHAAGAAAVGALGSAFAPTLSAQGPGPRQPNVAGIGLQLYTVRSLVDQDIVQTLESVAKVGYKVVEFAGYGKRTHAEIRSALDRLGMTAPSAHISLNVLRKELDAQVTIAQTIGHRYITVPSLGGDMPVTADGWKKMAAEFNQIGTKLQAKKIGLAFHSHRDEFMDVGGGKKGMDIFIGETDPKLVTFEIDLGWSWVANQNPVDWMKRYPGRVKMWHVKDILALKAAQDRQMEVFKNPPPAAPPVVQATQRDAARRRLRRPQRQRRHLHLRPSPAVLCPSVRARSTSSRFSRNGKCQGSSISSSSRTAARPGPAARWRRSRPAIGIW